MLAASDEPPARKNPAGMDRPEVVSAVWPAFLTVKVKEGAAVPDLVTAGLFDEEWKLK